MKKFEKRMYVIVGNIGSGKTTYCLKKLQDCIVIARDALRYMLGGGQYLFDPILEPAIWKSEQNILNNFMKIGINIAVDEVGVSRRLRHSYVKLAKKYKYKLLAIVLPRFSMKISVDRRLTNPHGQSDRKLWEEVWEKFDYKYTEPTIKEGFEEVIFIKEEEVC